MLNPQPFKHYVVARVASERHAAHAGRHDGRPQGIAGSASPAVHRTPQGQDVAEEASGRPSALSWRAKREGQG